MHFPNALLCLSSFLMATASASTATSFEVPGGESSSVPAPVVDPTTVQVTSTHYVTSAITVPGPVLSSESSSYNVPVVSTLTTEPANSTSCTTEPPVESTPSVFVSGSTTLTPITLWESSTTRVVYPQNSTAIAPTESLNATTTIVSTSTVNINITVSASKTDIGTSSKVTTATASVSEVPVNGAGRGAGNAVLGLGAMAGLMALF